MDKIYFSINGEHYSLAGSEVTPETTLNDYLRNHLNLRGTKAMCHEGGCGACVVSVSQTHPVTKEKYIFSVNSCLVHILSCHQWDITTIEGIGNRIDGYHKIQTRLATFNGTQCGYCTPGWVMNMYSLYESKGQSLKTKQIENSFAGNMCRCTGYRPILDAFKSLAIDTDDELKIKITDLEDLAGCSKTKCTKPCNTSENDWCIINECNAFEYLTLESKDSRWYKAFKIEDVFKILDKEGVNSYYLVAGNTGKGVYPLLERSRVLIDISSIESLKDSHTAVNLVIGAGMTLTEVVNNFRKWSTKTEEFKYLDILSDHMDLVAHVPVRNIGTIGGNLALKNQHHEFPSDIFLILDTIQATVTIVDKNLHSQDVNMNDFLSTDLNSKLIQSVKLPPLSSNHLLRTYKIMPRAQNAHAIVNAGFMFKVDSANKIVEANIVYGCISPKFVRATKTVSAIKGLNLFSDETLQIALNSLTEELNPDDVPPEPSPFCRRTLALGLFYKCVLSLSPKEKTNARYVSGGVMYDRPVSRGSQTFDTDKTIWPLNKPIPKLEALTQCSGEALYSNDFPSTPRELYVCFVLSTICIGQIDRFDASEALKLPGVVAFFSAKDIPGKNSFTPTTVPWQEFDEEILASDHISYCGQPIGLVAAVNEKLAARASKLVRVFYKNVSKKKPVLTIRDALNAPAAENRVREEVVIKPTNKGVNTTRIIKGSYEMKSQYHYTMEPQCCVVVPTEDQLDVYSSTQWIDLVHVAVAGCLNVQENSVNVTVRRVGGAYGGKASRSALAATACAIVAHSLRRPARLVMPLADNMAAVGKRQACLADYEVGINDNGEIQYLHVKYYSDCGFCFNDTSGGETANTMTNLYDTTRWHIQGNSVLTDKASNTWCRAPGTTEGTAIIEHIMERIAYEVNKHSTDIKLQHIAEKHAAVKEMVTSFQKDCQFDSRSLDIKKFNAENCWKKRAIKLSIMSYPIGYSGNFGVTISVYHVDGTVAISHGGVEMGQGVNTKVAQVCAHFLQIPLDKVAIKPSNNFVTPNAMASNGSITSECLAYATMKACEDLQRKLEPAKEELLEPTWEEVIKKAYNKGIDLQSSYMMSINDELKGYNVYGVGIAEVELDVLTGTHQVLRVDILEDTGRSISPEIDVGQIEGAFIMGLGLWTSENLIYDNMSGRLLTDRTWTYKPPGAKDIPLDFRVNFRRNSLNPAGVLRSKATGEPALVLAVVVTHALHDAILEARREYGHTDKEYVHVDTPYTVQNILKAISPNIESYKLK